MSQLINQLSMKTCVELQIILFALFCGYKVIKCVVLAVYSIFKGTSDRLQSFRVF